MIEFLFGLATGVFLTLFLSLVYVLARTDDPDGFMDVIEKEEGKKIYSLEINGDPAELENRDKIVFKVRSQGNHTV
jgi:hypothetical protein